MPFRAAVWESPIWLLTDCQGNRHVVKAPYAPLVLIHLNGNLLCGAGVLCEIFGCAVRLANLEIYMEACDVTIEATA